MSVSSSPTSDTSWSPEDSKIYQWPTLPHEVFEDGWLQSSISIASNLGDESTIVELERPVCSGCEERPAEKYCTKCNIFLCRFCADAVRTHRGEAPSHPVVSYQEHILFKEIVSHQGADRDEQHRDDFLSLWFSIEQGTDGKLELKQSPRFINLVEEHQMTNTKESDSCVQLVSFIGDTGAGKSTLIRVLMKQPWDMAHLTSNQETLVSLPVAGLSGSTIPTSSDVHLYALPNEHATGTTNLSLYADCEGFNGGDQEPLANRGRRSFLVKIGEVIEAKTAESLSWAKHALSFLRGTHSFPLGFKSTREEAVKTLFPRLLYNFSDVVVHVMASGASRTLEHVIVNLLVWAQNSQKTAVNRVILPHLIVVLNMEVNEDVDWETHSTTERILDEHLSALQNNHIINTYTRMLNQLRYVRITTVRELLNCCYSSVHIIRVPPAKNQHLFSCQVQALDSLIREAASQATRTKSEARCLLPAESQDKMFRMAFDHYKNNFEKPFDFLESLLAARPLNRVLWAILSALLRAASRAYCDTTAEVSGVKFCNIITPLVCSAIALDAYRHSGEYPGKMGNIYTGSTLNRRFGGEDNDTATYQSQFAAAIRDFLEKSCRCHFVYEGQRCVNSLQGHKASMHQSEAGATYFGSFESKFVDEWTMCWDDVIDECFYELDDVISQAGTAGQPKVLIMVWSTHCLNLQNLYTELPRLDVTGLYTCSWCFYSEPSELLECGHWVCWACAELVGDILVQSSEEGKAVVAIDCCEFHPATFRFKNSNHVKKIGLSSRI